ncbi:thiamine-phosphate synthase family protein [Chloroflexota bacterium]
MCPQRASQEPNEVIEHDGASMPWKVKQLFSKCRVMPRLSYEEAGWGKEPLFLAIGKNGGWSRQNIVHSVLGQEDLIVLSLTELQKM